MVDNFFSESLEIILIDTLNKNQTLTELSLKGNRLSHTCLKKVKQIINRNIKAIEEKEPNKLKAAIYKLKYEQQKLDKAKEGLKA